MLLVVQMAHYLLHILKLINVSFIFNDFQDQISIMDHVYISNYLNIHSIHMFFSYNMVYHI